MRRTTTVLLAAALAATPLAGSAAADDQGAKRSSGQTEQSAQDSARKPGTTEQRSAAASGAMRSDEIIGADVVDQQGEEIGSVRSLLIDKDGKVEAAVIALGGVLGMGSRQVKVPWNELQLKPKADDPDELMVMASRDTLQKAPQFEGASGVTARSVLDSMNPAADDDKDSRAAERTNE